MATAAVRCRRNPAWLEATDPEGLVQTLGAEALLHIAVKGRQISARQIVGAIRDPDLITKDGPLVRSYYQWSGAEQKWLKVVTRPALNESVRTAYMTKRIRRREIVAWTRRD